MTSKTTKIPAKAISAVRSALPWHVAINLTDKQIREMIRAILAAMAEENG